MKIFLLDPLFNRHGESDWAGVQKAEKFYNEQYGDIVWDQHCGQVNLDGCLKITVSTGCDREAAISWVRLVLENGGQPAKIWFANHISRQEASSDQRDSKYISLQARGPF